MECKYGGGLFLQFQPLTDCMLCEGVGLPYCRLYYLWNYPPHISCVRQLIKPNIVYKDTTRMTNHMIWRIPFEFRFLYQLLGFFDRNYKV
jgi:hypothetical protein